MSDYIDINVHVNPSLATATTWFDTINQNRCSAATAALLAAGSPSRISSSQPNAMEFTPSTIRYDEDSGGSPRGIFSSTHSPMQQQQQQQEGRDILRVESARASSHDSVPRTATPLFGASASAASRTRSRHDTLYEDAMRAQLAKRQWAAVEQMRQSMLETARVERDCPFTPHLSSYAAKIRRPAELAPQHRIYDELMRKEQWRAKKRRENVERELDGCTFRPLTLRAATLKSSAHVHDSYIFSELYHHHEEQKRFKDELQPYVVEQLERHMLFKNPANNPLPEDKVNAVVERLFSRGVVVRPEDGRRQRARSTSPSFKPTVNTESERIAARQRECGLVPEDVVERLLTRPLVQQLQELRPRPQDGARRLEDEMEWARSQYNRELRVLLQRERRRTFLSAKFDALSSFIKKEQQQQQQQRQGSNRSATECQVEDLKRVAALLLSSEEAEELSSILAQCGASNLSKGNFVALCEGVVEGLPDPNVSPLGRLPPPRLPAAGAAALGSDNASKGPKPHTFQREVPPQELIEEMRMKRAERQRRDAEKEAQRRRAMEDEQQQQCTFRPLPRRKIPHECRVDYNVEVKTTKAEALRRAYIQKTLEAEDHVGVSEVLTASTRELFGCDRRQPQPRSQSAGAVGTPAVSRQLRTTPALAMPLQSSPPAKGPSPKRNRREEPRRVCSTQEAGPLKRRETAAVVRTADRSPTAAAAGGGSSDRSSEDAADLAPRGPHMAEAQPRVYRDVVSEHAAFGRNGALTEFGRELILRQLREYRPRHK